MGSGLLYVRNERRLIMKFAVWNIVPLIRETTEWRFVCATPERVIEKSSKINAGSTGFFNQVGKFGLTDSLSLESNVHFSVRRD